MDRIKGKVVYLAGPITDEEPIAQKWNLDYAIDTAADLRREGVIVISPHEMGYHFPEVLTYEQWMRADLKILRRCDAVVFLPGWRASKGCGREYKEALRRGIPMFELRGDRWALKEIRHDS